MTGQHPAVAYLELAHLRADVAARALSADRWFTAALDMRARLKEEHAAASVAMRFILPEQPSVVAEYFEVTAPEATLRRIAADRRILAEHASDGGWQGGYCVRCADDHPDDCDCGSFIGNGAHARQHQDYPCATVLDLAAGWGWETGT